MNMTLKDRLVRISLLAVAIAISAASLTGCTRNPATGRFQLSLVSDAEVASMGHAAAPELTKEYGGEVKSKALRDYVNEVGQDVALWTEPEYDHIQWTFTVLDSDVINAFALPGGYVYISRGLLQRFENEAQVAGVLGHEIGHVTARHIKDRITSQMAAEIALRQAGQVTDSELAILTAQAVASGTLLSFSRGQELEADAQGMKYMTAAGYDPVGMVEVLQVLEEASEGQLGWEMLSTHPHPDTRLKKARNLITSQYNHTIDNPSFTKDEDRFRSRAAPYLK